MTKMSRCGTLSLGTRLSCKWSNPMFYVDFCSTLLLKEKSGCRLHIERGSCEVCDSCGCCRNIEVFRLWKSQPQ